MISDEWLVKLKFRMWSLGHPRSTSLKRADLDLFPHLGLLRFKAPLDENVH